MDRRTCRSFGRSPGDTKFQICQSVIGSEITMPTTAEIFNGTVSPSVGLVMIASSFGMMLCELASTVCSGCSRIPRKKPLKMKAIAVPMIHAPITQMRTLPQLLQVLDDRHPPFVVACHSLHLTCLRSARA